MSFPRARIQRFNDASSCAPPPGSYDPKFDAKIKGTVIEKTERFVEPKCPSVSSSSAESPANLSLTSSSSKSTSVNCLPVFRTPQLPRRVIKVNSAPQTKIKLKFESSQKNGGSSKEVKAELYEALLVDRDNKDLTIRENETHIDELYERIRTLEKQLNQLQLEKDALFEKHKTGNNSEMLVKFELQSNELIDVKQELKKTLSALLDVREKCSTLENTVSENRLLLASVEQEKQDLLSKVNKFKDNEEESRLRYEMDIKELDALCKKLVDEMTGVRAEEEKRKDLEEEVKKLKEELSNLGNTISDLDNKLSQKQQMILMLQSELSSAELELEECKSESEKMVMEFKNEKAAMSEKHGSEMEDMKTLIKELERLLSDEREIRVQEIQTLEENVLNGSVVRDNLETIISDKQSALSALSDKYLALEEEFEKYHMEQNLVAEAHRLEMDEIYRKHEEELCEVRDLMNEKEKEVEKRVKEVMEVSAKEVEERVKEVKAAADEDLKEVKNASEKRIKEFEVEAAATIKECESRVEVKLKEAELEMHVSLEKATQAEEELRRITHHRDELRISNMENQLTIVDLQDKIDTLVTELNSARESYEADLAQARADENATKKQCKKLNIGICNLQASLEALRMRLLESGRDVEQLTNATQQVQTQNAALKEQVNILTRELEAGKQSMRLLEMDTVQQIEDTRKDLLCKLEEFKVKADRNVAAKEEEILEHRHKTEELSAKIFELVETLSAVEETNTEHEHEIEALTEKLDHQRDCAQIATRQIATLEASNAIYHHQIQALTAELDYQKDFSQKASEHIATLAEAKTNQEKAIYELTSEILAEREKISKLNGGIEKSSSDHLSALKENFERYKEEITYVVSKLKSDIKTKVYDIEQKNIDICRKKCEIKKATDRIAELMSENATKEEKIVEHNKKMEELRSEVEEIKTSIQEKLDSGLKLKLVEKEKHFQSLQDETDNWQKRCKELELLIGPFREQLEAFDAERQALELQKETAECEMRDLGLRYAEILGHQNHKQKIKHVIKLKEQIYELKKENEKLESQMRAQKRVIDKLKDDQRSSVSARKPVLQQHNPSSTKGKENVDHSPVRKSPVSSPNVKSLRRYR